jgi:hypothetical protein
VSVEVMRLQIKEEVELGYKAKTQHTQAHIFTCTHHIYTQTRSVMSQRDVEVMRLQIKEEVELGHKAKTDALLKQVDQYRSDYTREQNEHESLRTKYRQTLTDLRDKYRPGKCSCLLFYISPSVKLACFTHPWHLFVSHHTIRDALLHKHINT